MVRIRATAGDGARPGCATGRGSVGFSVVRTIAIGRRRAIVGALAVAAAGAFATQAPASHQDPPYRLKVSSHGLTANATLGSFCQSVSNHDGTGSSFCADAAYPLETRGRVPVHPGARVRFKTNYRARSVSVAPVHFSRDGERFGYGDSRRARPRGDAGRAWSVRLSGRLEPRTRALDVFIRYPGRGDADFWAGLNVHQRHDR